jgi:hypothetical protein
MLVVAFAACSGSPTRAPAAPPQQLSSTTTPIDAAPDDDATTVLSAHVDVVKQCYRDRLELQPELAGKLYVTVRFDGQGEVTNLAVSGVDDAPLIQCVTDGFTHAHLHLSPPDGQPTEATVPFVLVPS